MCIAELRILKRTQKSFCSLLLPELCVRDFFCMPLTGSLNFVFFKKYCYMIENLDSIYSDILCYVETRMQT